MAPIYYGVLLFARSCADVFMTLQAINVKPLACKLIYGDKTPGTFKRALTRMVADAQHMDMYTIFWSG
jgi:hypothetical protein